MTVLVACEYCGGVLEPAIIAGTAAAWGWGCYMLARVFGWIRRPEPEKPPCQCVRQLHLLCDRPGEPVPEAEAAVAFPPRPVWLRGRR